MFRALLALCGPVLALGALGRSLRTTDLSRGVPALSVSVKNVIQGAHVVVANHATNGSLSKHDSHVERAIKHVNSGAHLAVGRQAANRSRYTIDSSSQAIKAAIEDFLDGPGGGQDDIEKKLDEKAAQEGVDEIVAELGDKLPTEVASLLHVERENQPLDEGSIERARKALNGMMEKAQVALDKKVIECKEFKEKNRGAEAQVVGDLARLGGMLADLARQESEANKGINEADGQMQKVEELRAEETKTFMELKKADEATMAERKKDLDVATFILKFTRCKSFLLQEPSNQTGDTLTLQTCDLPNGAMEMHFEDEHMEAEAQKLTPEAREALWVYLGNNPSNRSAGLQVHGADDDIDDDDDDSEYDLDRELTANDLGIENLMKHVKEDHTMALVKQPPTPGVPPVMPPGKGMSKKCTLGKPNCGLLHDNMSLMWGKMKDAVDLLQIKMDKDAAAFKELMDDMNAQTTNLGGQKATLQTQMSGATSEKASVGEDQKGKQEEQRILNKEFKNVWGECKQTIYEILFTNICGVRQVRGEISKKSTRVPPDAITDCEVSDWVPKECTKTCDDSCALKKPGDDDVCGGTQELAREIVQKPNEYGAKCPVLSLTKVCGQIPCPVDCKMGEWSEWNMCTKECDGGVQGRTRPILAKPENNGATCKSAQEMRGCNTGACKRPCELKDAWEPFGPCSQMCDGGEQTQIKKIKVKARAGGECPKVKSPKRFRKQKCNVAPCKGDEQCIAKVDLIIAVDGSGSITDKGFATLRDFTKQLVGRFEGRAYGVDAMQVGVVLFGNGRVNEDGTISDGRIVSQLSGNLKDVQDKIDTMVWKKGFTNLAQAFTSASKLLTEGRKHATSAIMILTDGKPSFKVQTLQAVNKVRKSGVVVNIVSVNAFPNKPDRRFMRKLASSPWKSNFVAIPGLTKLRRQMDKYITRVLVQTCPKAESPTVVKETEKMQGWKLLREGAWCGAKPTKGEDQNRVLLSEEPVPDIFTCGNLALKAEVEYFSFGTERGFNFGQCYHEITMADDEDCLDHGWTKTSVNTFAMLPPMKV